MDEKDVQFQLGALTGQVKGVQGWVKNLADKMEENTKATAALTTAVGKVCEHVKSLPCEERLNSCHREISGLRKSLNGRVDEKRSTTVRRWGMVGAFGSGAIVAVVEIARWLWG